MKETDTETEKLIYFDLRRFRDCSNKITFQMTVNRIYFRAYLETILKTLVQGSNVKHAISWPT